MKKKSGRIILIVAVLFACWLQFPVGMHIKRVIPGKQATCTETGLTEGRKCSLCGKILVAQKEIPVTGVHVYSDDFDKNCNICSYTREVNSIFDFVNHRVVLIDENQKHSNWRVVLYKLGDKTVEDPSDENALQAIDSNATTYWGVMKINEIQLMDPGNYVLLLKYNIGKAAAIKVPMPVTVKDEPMLMVDDENRVKIIENNTSNKNHILTVYNMGEAPIKDPENEADVQNAAISAKTYTGKAEIDEMVITKGGNYLLYLHYETADGTKKMVVQSETFVARPSLRVDAENRLVVICDDETITNLRVFTYYLGDQSVIDIYDERALKDLVGEPKAYWGLKQIDKAVLNEQGVYVIHLQYNVETGPKKTIALKVNIESVPNNDSPDGESLSFVVGSAVFSEKVKEDLAIFVVSRYNKLINFNF